MGCYIAPSDVVTIDDVSAAIRDQPYGDKLLGTGDLNANLTEPEGTPQGEAIAEELAATGIMDTGLHFLPQSKPWLQDRRTWSMRRYGQEVQSWKDYILGTYCRLFQDVDVRDP